MITLFLKQFFSCLEKTRSFTELRHKIEGNTLPISVCGGQSGFNSLLCAYLFTRTAGSILIVCSTSQEAENLGADLKLLTGGRTLFFPDWEVLPFSRITALNQIFSDRVNTLVSLLTRPQNLVVTTIRALLTPVPPTDYLSTRLIRLKKSSAVNLPALSAQLVRMGYLRVPRVSVVGEFAVRGEVVDIFLPGQDEAVRITASFDEVEEIKLFDPQTQSSIQKLQELIIFPSREASLEEEQIVRIAAYFSSEDPAVLKPFIEQLSLNSDAPDIQWFYPLCFETKTTLLDYLKPRDLVLYLGAENLQLNSQTIHKEFLSQYRLAHKSLLPQPKDILLDLNELKTSFTNYVDFLSLKPLDNPSSSPVYDLACQPSRSFFGNFSYLKEELANLLAQKYQVTIFAVYDKQAERLKAILPGFPVQILPLPLSAGFTLPEQKLLVITEGEIFGRKKRIPQSIKQAETSAIESFIDLNEGDYIVHINHGIGLYEGIERIKAAGHERDYIRLKYSDNETIFIPIEQVNLVQKYIGAEGSRVKLDKIGGKGWSNRKERVRKSAEELAKQLISLYSQRMETAGFAFGKDREWQKEFEAGFPYQETADQLRCIVEVKDDMEKPYPMDRLICGDVGYGKTEIALRSIFKAVMAGKQTALLAPTTILVEQHFETFSERFKNFPVRIDMLSRFCSKERQRRTIAGLAQGEVDIVIGTHRLLQKDVGFKELGLVVIDEEQRFGVKHKERLKELKTTVDCLALSATPIPRTLHMSLVKIRDMSILNTPPYNRHPIETVIAGFNDDIVKRAVRFELKRGGQVFYLHNRIETMSRIHAYLEQLMPDVSIRTAHGRMPAEELEDIMHQFIHNEFQILLSTTIIENGLDIPNVNTIIIDRADIFGISQLYQLKGRVGRSDIPAYAYLLYPEKSALTELAMKRLKIISDFTDLGSGFKIALKDLEIRGAGNLLGREQSGEILAVGYDMYIQILNEAVNDLRQVKDDKPPEVYLELEYSGFVPDSYITDAMEKMHLYKKIAAITEQSDHDRVYHEIEDRFGPLPNEVLSILSIAEIKIICKKLYISSLTERQGTATVEFARLSQIDTDKVLRLIKESHNRVFLNHKRPNCLLLRTGQIGLKEKSEYLKDQLTRLL